MKQNEKYQKQMMEVCDYIYSHLDEELTVDKLSKVAHFSKFHFHRQFSYFMGISVSKYIQQLRMKRASYQLYFDKEKSILDVALDARFEYPESFSRAFKKEFEQSPSEFRNQADWLLWNKKYRRVNAPMEKNMRVEIQSLPQTNIAVFEHRGSPNQVNQSAQQFIHWRKSSGLSPIKTSRTFGLAYDDPQTVASNDFRFDICGEIATPIEENEFGIVNKIIPSGRYAVLRHLGSHDNLDITVRSLFSDWLPNSDETLGDFPIIFHYLNFFPEVTENELITDVFLLLE